jgi:2-oxoglutarate ferredoxin oxidoreductase subunit beta
MKSKASPGGTKDEPLNATLMALSYGATFVARLFAGDPITIADVLMEGTRHEGFSFFHIYTSCVTFDKSFKTWDNLKDRVHPLPDGHDPGNVRAAVDLVMEDDFCLGIIHKRM